MPILLLHGQPGRGRDWQPLIAAIGRRSDALGEPADVLAIDRPGWDGRTSAGGYALSAAAATDALDRAGWSTATVIGHSHGAAVAAWMAIEQPERVDSLVLVAPAANVASLLALDRLLAARRIETVASYAFSLTARAVASSRTIRRTLARAFGVDPAWLGASALWLTDRGRWRPFFVEQRLQLRELPVLESRLGLVSVPTTVVAGDRDPVVPLRSARVLARQIGHAELIVLAGGGHMLAAQHPERLAEIALAAAPAQAGPSGDQQSLGPSVSHASSMNARAAGG